MKAVSRILTGLALSWAVTAGATPASNIVSSGSKYSGEPATWTSAPASTVTSGYCVSFDMRAYLEWLLAAPDPFKIPGLLVIIR